LALPDTILYVSLRLAQPRPVVLSVIAQFDAPRLCFVHIQRSETVRQFFDLPPNQGTDWRKPFRDVVQLGFSGFTSQEDLERISSCDCVKETDEA